MCAGGMRRTLLSLLTPCFCSRFFRSGRWVFWSLCYLLPQIFPNCTCVQLFLVPYSSFVFCRSRRGASTCKHCSKGSRVPACLSLRCFVTAAMRTLHVQACALGEVQGRSGTSIKPGGNPPPRLPRHHACACVRKQSHGEVTRPAWVRPSAMGTRGVYPLFPPTHRWLPL